MLVLGRGKLQGRFFLNPALPKELRKIPVMVGTCWNFGGETHKMSNYSDRKHEFLGPQNAAEQGKWEFLSGKSRLGEI